MTTVDVALGVAGIMTSAFCAVLAFLFERLRSKLPTPSTAFLPVWAEAFLQCVLPTMPFLRPDVGEEGTPGYLSMIAQYVTPAISWKNYEFDILGRYIVSRTYSEGVRTCCKGGRGS